MIQLQTWILSALLAFSTHIFASPKAPKPRIIVLGIDDFCPYTCLETDKPGFLVETIDQVLSQSGYTLNLVRGSWTRIQMLAQKGKVDLIGPITPYYAAKHKIPATQELGGFFQAGFLALADASWQFVDYSSLDKLKIAAVKDYSYPAEIEKHLDLARREQRYAEIVGDSANRRLVQMLASKRVDTVPMLSAVFYYNAMLLGLSADKFKMAKEIPLAAELSSFRVGVLIKNPEERAALIQILDQGFASLKAKGIYKKILMKYGLNVT